MFLLLSGQLSVFRVISSISKQWDVWNVLTNTRTNVCVSGHFVDLKTMRCVKCSYCYPHKPGLAVREEGCWEEPGDWQCRPLAYTTNVTLSGTDDDRSKDYEVCEVFLLLPAQAWPGGQGGGVLGGAGWLAVPTSRLHHQRHTLRYRWWWVDA